ncbi:MAG: hypothetical protein Q8M94_20970 [Ignavibacteria bacterium]|nr:hypothetical protein [Ignavibacteria bacterium]
MILICAWCRKDMGEKAPWSNKDITHGICKLCADDLKMKYGMSEILTSGDIEMMEKYLDKRKGL